MNNKIKVLGVDPSFRNWGMAKALLDCDTMELEILDLKLTVTEGQAGKTVRKNSDDLRRAKEIHNAFHAWARDASIVISEIPQGAQSARAAWSLGIALGIVASCPRPLIQVTPTEVKLASVGKKTASKQEMIDWAADTHPDAPWLRRKLKGETKLLAANEHLADACAILEAGVVTDEFAHALAIMQSMKAA